ncbi:ATP-dependent helicase HrpB [Brevundimonas denitrificans]|uniref:ATP-dependent helicase HrpB n=1 Tax=Brevundimonas denitrificans TaxID=1443434 RepID=UPI00223B61BA|nr:ATP-dependent helicase HrpB [Brevundimonas denitrificans]
MLPIHEVLEPLKAALAARNAVVLSAPPGAGKTTVVPLALLDQPWLDGRKVLVLEPRRLAARAAAERMAQTLGEPAGQTVGYRTRAQTKVSAATRIEVITEGVFTRMILSDPGLEGIGAVLFDEFHERSLDADLGLALAREAQGLLRDDLRLLVMSATLDQVGIAALLDDAPVIESQGRMFPVETRYPGRNPAERIEDAVARAVRLALSEETGSMLVFLPGQGEIRRVHERLAPLENDRLILAPLYGALDRRDQDRAIEPAPEGVRKIVLATAIAETSLTIQGVRVVIDAGLSRVPRFDPASGLSRLATVPVSRSSADQRRGRAGRTEPGVCYRLWDAEQTRGLAPHQRPEILEADLTGFALDLARWGARSLEDLALLDPPPAGAFAEARAVLTRLGALDEVGGLTPHGERIAAIPLSPRLAHMAAFGADEGDALTAARVAALLSEAGLGGDDADLGERLRRLERDGSVAGEGCAGAGGPLGEGGGRRPDGAGRFRRGRLLAEAFPDRIAKARGKPGEYQLASGRGAFVEPTDALARHTWLAVGELGRGARCEGPHPAGGAAGRGDHRRGFRAAVERRGPADRRPVGPPGGAPGDAAGRPDGGRGQSGRPDRATLTAALMGEVARSGLDSLPWGEAARSLRSRLAFLRARDDSWPDVSDDALWAAREAWLAPLLDQVSSLKGVQAGALHDALRGLIPWDLHRRIEAEAPERFTTPLGTGAAIDYAAEGGPRVEVRVQELFGMKTHPVVGGDRTPLTLALLSPARRPIQVTKDLPGFWAGSWADVRADMRGRYPKHPWPEDPANADPTNRVKPRGT